MSKRLSLTLVIKPVEDQLLKYKNLVMNLDGMEDYLKRELRYWQLIGDIKSDEEQVILLYNAASGSEDGTYKEAKNGQKRIKMIMKMPA